MASFQCHRGHNPAILIQAQRTMAQEIKDPEKLLESLRDVSARLRLRNHERAVSAVLRIEKCGAFRRTRPPGVAPSLLFVGALRPPVVIRSPPHSSNKEVERRRLGDLVKMSYAERAHSGMRHHVSKAAAPELVVKRVNYAI